MGKGASRCREIEHLRRAPLPTRSSIAQSGRVGKACAPRRRGSLWGPAHTGRPRTMRRLSRIMALAEGSLDWAFVQKMHVLMPLTGRKRWRIVNGKRVCTVSSVTSIGRLGMQSFMSAVRHAFLMIAAVAAMAMAFAARPAHATVLGCPPNCGPPPPPPPPYPQYLLAPTSPTLSPTTPNNPNGAVFNVNDATPGFSIGFDVNDVSEIIFNLSIQEKFLRSFSRPLLRPRIYTRFHCSKPNI